MFNRSKWICAGVLCLVGSGLALAQGPGGPGGLDGGRGFGGPPGGGPPMERTFHDGQFGRWWENPKIAQAIGLTDDQKKKMDDIFQQHRLHLIDLKANLEKAEVEMHPLIEADQPDESQVLAQIDKVAQARAELEKADARMLFDVRKTLTADQWQKLKALHAEHREDMMRRDGGRGPAGPGPTSWQHRPAPPSGPGSSAGSPPPPQGGGLSQGDAELAPPPTAVPVAPGDGPADAPAAPQF
jgi:periplasmic protein CpxP/Spy